MFSPGTLVVCSYRMPPSIQPWIHDIYVGTVEGVSDTSIWAGKGSEQNYCEVTRTARVRYTFGVQYDHLDSLMSITPEQAALSPREKVGEFLGTPALACLDRHCPPKVKASR